MLDLGWMSKGDSVSLISAGDLDFVDVADACLAVTGPAVGLVASWTTSTASMSWLQKQLESGRLTACRAVFGSRLICKDVLYEKLRSSVEAVKDLDYRISVNHMKVGCFRGPKACLGFLGSANMNRNRRGEQFDVYCGPEVVNLLDELWEKVKFAFAPGFELKMKDVNEVFRSVRFDVSLELRVQTMEEIRARLPEFGERSRLAMSRLKGWGEAW